LGGVLDQQQPALVAPSPPPGRVLREAERVDDVERADARPGQLVQLPLGGLDRPRGVVEPAAQSGPHQRLDLRPVVVGGGEDLIAGGEPHGGQRVPEALAGLRVEPAAGLGERERQRSPRAAQVDPRRERHPDRQERLSAAHEASR
jgi:hypothetical protein